MDKSIKSILKLDQDDISFIQIFDEYNNICVPLLFKIESCYENILHSLSEIESIFYNVTKKEQDFIKLHFSISKRVIFSRINFLASLIKNFKNKIEELDVDSEKLKKSLDNMNLLIIKYEKITLKLEIRRLKK